MAICKKCGQRASVVRHGDLGPLCRECALADGVTQEMLDWLTLNATLPALSNDPTDQKIERYHQEVEALMDRVSELEHDLASEHKDHLSDHNARSEAERVAQDARNDNEAIHRELDYLGAPRRQDNGFGYSPLGRLRVLSVNEAGRGLVESIYRERDEARKRITDLEAALDELVQSIEHADGATPMQLACARNALNALKGGA